MSGDCNKQQAAELLALQETLYQSRNPTRRWLHTRRRQWVEDSLDAAATQLRGLHGRPLAAMEVGPGSGIYLPRLSTLFDQVTALDIEPAYLQQAEQLAGKHSNLSIVHSDLCADELPAHSVDLILCSEVLEHVPDTLAMLRSLQRLLSPGGVLLLSTPQKYSPLELCAKIAFLPGIIDLVRLVYREPILETGHISLLTAGALKQQIDDSGLQIEQSHLCGFYLPVIAELCGHSGQRLLSWLERRLRNSPLNGLLWTQCYRLSAASRKDPEPA